MTVETTKPRSAEIALTADIVAAYVRNNSVPSSELPKLIAETYGAIVSLEGQPQIPVEAKPAPAVPVKKSVTPDHLVCLEDGRQFKSLKRHLASHYNLTPDQYREKWGLPRDYPMTAPNYSATRSALAKATGLGRKSAPAVPEPAPKRKKLGLKFG